MGENPMDRLRRIADRDDRFCLGLISGTSADGVDAALCKIQGRGETARLQLILHAAHPFDRALRRRIFEVSTVKELCELNFALGRAFAEAALATTRRSGVPADKVDVIGSHGQTVYHLPPYMAGVPSTLQIGEAAVIAEMTGILTVSDFRVRDVAAGGHGAPLVPYADHLLFRAPGKVRALQNLGGIANVTVVGDRSEDLIAFDTGPGNMALDNIARRITGNPEMVDRDGSLSKQGQVNAECLAELMRHPYIQLAPPKTAGREVFGDAFCDDLWERWRSHPYDLLATLARFTAKSIAHAYRTFVAPRNRIDEVYLSGGGCRNPTLFRMIEEELAPLPVRKLDALGFPEQAKEAAAFALLAHECLNGIPQNVPRATGAARKVVMGKISL
jgi:anhydro-N-acetylmuramic acid kinase